MALHAPTLVLLSTALPKSRFGTDAPPHPMREDKRETQVFTQESVRMLTTGEIGVEGNDFNLLVVLVFQHGSVLGDNDIGLSNNGILGQIK